LPRVNETNDDDDDNNNNNNNNNNKVEKFVYIPVLHYDTHFGHPISSSPDTSIT
jgi:hypothetical protein